VNSRYILYEDDLLFVCCLFFFFFFSSRRRHTRCLSDWSSDVCSSDLVIGQPCPGPRLRRTPDMADRLRSTAALTFREDLPLQRRSEERRVGKECRSRWSTDQ